MTDFSKYGPFDSDIPVPDRTVGRRPRDDEKKNLIREGAELYKNNKVGTYRSAALMICPRYYLDWECNPALKPGRIETLARYISEILKG